MDACGPFASRQLFFHWFAHGDPLFGGATPLRRTTEAPPRRESRRGRISGHFGGLEVITVPLCSRANASFFWITLLLIRHFGGESQRPSQLVGALNPPI